MAQPEGRKTGPRQGLYQAISVLTEELSLDVVLQKVVDLSRELVGASYAALGVLSGDGRLGRFITSGISQRARERIDSLPEGKGVLGVVLRDGRALRIADLSQHPESVGFPPHHPMMKSFLGVPVISKGRVLGNLYLTNKVGAVEFSVEDEALVTLFATQAAVAMENARLFEAETRRSQQLDVVNRIGRSIAGILDLDQLLQTVAHQIERGFGYQDVQLFWVDHANETVWVRAQSGVMEGKTPLGDTQGSDIGLVGWAVTNRESVLCNDVSREPRYFAPPGFETCAELSVPVISQDQVVAVINVEAMEPDVFDESDLKTLDTVADQLSAAIYNLMLYQQQQEQFRRLAVVEERDRIGKDLHDGVIQSIYAVGLDLEDIGARLKEHPQECEERIGGAVGDLNQVIADIRRYIMDLRPRELQGRELDEALNSMVQYLEDKTGAKVSLDSQVAMAQLAEQHVVNLWHMLQEAFSNIEKYARATRVSVSMTTDNQHLNLRIADDGVGFDMEKAEASSGYGLSNIKDRAERLGGILTIESGLGKGTVLNVKVPLPKTNSDHERGERVGH